MDHDADRGEGEESEVTLERWQAPVLVVHDLKLGENAAGGVGLWVDNGTEGYLTELKIRRE